VTSGWMFLISFVAIMAGIVIGMYLRRHVDLDRLGPATKEVIRLGASYLATLSAVLISLMIASAKSSYDSQDAHFRTLAAYLVETDQLLAQYGPDTTEIRILMRQAVPAAVDRIWREKRSAVQDSAFTAASLAEQVNSAVATLKLVADLSQPFVGLMQIPKEQVRHTLAPLN
jgi:hypothetical protein